MKIIQSFAQFEEGSHYVEHKKGYDVICLTFYSTLLSYITIKKYYGHVTMFCNQKAYDSFVKYIPYDEIILMENKNDFTYWSMYKVDSLRYFDDDVIHIDSDVFLFDDLLSEFINGEADVIIQDFLTARPNIVGGFVHDNLDYLRESGIFTKEFDGGSISGGVIGMKKHVRDIYFNAVDILKNEIDENRLKNVQHPTTILDEQLLYLLIIEKGLSVYDIIPQDVIKEHGITGSGDVIGYAHMWQDSKYHPENIMNIKRNILFNHPNYQSYVIKYESEVMMKTKIFYDFGLGF